MALTKQNVLAKRRMIGKLQASRTTATGTTRAPSLPTGPLPSLPSRTPTPLRTLGGLHPESAPYKPIVW